MTKRLFVEREEAAVIERDEVDETAVPEADPIRKAISEAISAVFETTDDATKRSLAIGVLIETHRRVLAILSTARPRLN